MARDRRLHKQRGISKAVHEEMVLEDVLAPEQAVAFDGLSSRRLDDDCSDFVDIPSELILNSLETARRFVAATRRA